MPMKRVKIHTFTPFWINASILYHLKTPENPWFRWVRGYLQQVLLVAFLNTFFSILNTLSHSETLYHKIRLLCEIEPLTY